jgi:hypothetical protein
MALRRGRRYLSPMPKGPRGEKRPADTVGLAVLIGKIATGEVEDTRDEPTKAKRIAGKKGAAARAKALTPRERSEIASAAASARWKKT